jgi:AMP deaminase
MQSSSGKRPSVAGIGMAKRTGTFEGRAGTFDGADVGPSFTDLSLASQLAEKQGGAPVTHEAVTGWNFVFTEDSLSQELKSLLSSLKRCLELRAEYQAMSLQRLGDNPKDADDWKIYPPPPAPSYRISTDNDRIIYEKIPENEMPPDAVFDYDGCCNSLGLPEKDPERWYRMGTDGVYRVYTGDEKATIPIVHPGSKLEDANPITEETSGPKAVFHVPTMRDYYVKLEYLLQVIGDGPTKSFAFRRLRYLESKFQMYTLLNDYQEMAESKVYICHID